MSTFGYMVEQIRGDINRGSSFDSRIKEAIVNAISYYQGRRFTFNIKRATASTVASQEYYAWPVDFMEADMIRILYPSGSFTDPLDEVTYRWIEEHRHNVNYESEPEKFATQGSELRLWPVPDQVYELTLTYLFKDTAVSLSASDGATSAWVQIGKGYELIKPRAQADVLENKIGGQNAVLKAQLQKSRERDVYASLRRLANRQHSAGKITPHL